MQQTKKNPNIANYNLYYINSFPSLKAKYKQVQLGECDCECSGPAQEDNPKYEGQGSFTLEQKK